VSLPPVSAAEVEAGLLRWGSDAEGGAPYVFPDPERPGRLIGFEVDLAEALAREMGLSARQVQVDWSSLIPGLDRGDYDIALNGIEWTAGRNRASELSFPYFIFAQQLVVRADDASIQSFADVQGKRVATLGATAAHQILRETPGVDPVIYQGQVEPYRDLKLGRVDAVLLDTPIAEFYAKPDPALRYAGPSFAAGTYVIAVKKSNTGLLTRVNRGLDALLRSGKLQEIYMRWGLWNESQARLMDRAPPQAAVARAANDSGLLRYLPLLMKGAGMTVALSVIAMALAIVAGLALCLLRLGGNPVLKPLAVGYIEVMRGTPLLLQLYVIYYGLPNIGINLDAFSAAVLGLGLNYAAYEAEIYRAGINSIPRGQTEAALSLGMTPAMIYRRVLIPQAVRVTLPPVTNDFISLFKDSSLVSIIALVELTKTYNMLAVSSMRFLELGVLTGILYLCMSFPLSILSTRLERRLHLAAAR